MLNNLSFLKEYYEKSNKLVDGYKKYNQDEINILSKKLKYLIAYYISKLKNILQN